MELRTTNLLIQEVNGNNYDCFDEELQSNIKNLTKGSQIFSVTLVEEDKIIGYVNLTFKKNKIVKKINYAFLPKYNYSKFDLEAIKSLLNFFNEEEKINKSLHKNHV